jgi:DNA-binding NtrC family response regulator
VDGGPDRPGFLEEADGGTLFINNIELLPLPVQIRLDRVIQYREFHREYSPRVERIDVRVVVASLHNLAEAGYQESFSQDLLYHLMVNSLHLPPLRERRDAIPVLANDILQREVRRMNRPIEGFSDELMELLLKYDFPGNVQELNDIVATCVINAESSVVGMDSLSHYMKDILTSGGRDLMGFRTRRLDEVVREHVSKTVRYMGGDKAKAAVELGIDVDSLAEILDED